MTKSPEQHQFTCWISTERGDALPEYQCSHRGLLWEQPPSSPTLQLPLGKDCTSAFCYTKKSVLSFKPSSKASLSSQRGCDSINRPVPIGLCCPAGRHFQVLVQRAHSHGWERFVAPCSCSGPAHQYTPKGSAGRTVFYHPCIHLVLGVRKKGTALHLHDHCQVQHVPAYH